MVIETKVKVGGAWKVLVGVQVKVAGAWKDVSTIEAKVAGAWKKVLESGCDPTAGTSFIGSTTGSCAPSICLLKSDVDAPTNGEIGAKWETDGGVYFYEDVTPSWPEYPASRQYTWIGGCPNTDYDGRWVQVSGDDPQTADPAVNVWRQMSLGGVLIEFNKNSGDDTGFIKFELRRRSDNVTILTDHFEFHAEACTGK